MAKDITNIWQLEDFLREVSNSINDQPPPPKDNNPEVMYFIVRLETTKGELLTLKVGFAPVFESPDPAFPDIKQQIAFKIVDQEYLPEDQGKEAVLPAIRRFDSFSKIENEVLMRVDADLLWKQYIDKVSEYITQRSTAFANALNDTYMIDDTYVTGVTQGPNGEAVQVTMPNFNRTYAMGWSEEMNRYLLLFNTYTPIRTTLFDYFYNKSRYTSFENMYFYNLVFGICHELSHRMEEHLINRSQVFADCTDHNLSNISEDAYINMALTDLLYDKRFVNKPVTPAFMIGDETIFGSSKKGQSDAIDRQEATLQDEFVGKPVSKILDAVLEEFSKYVSYPVEGKLTPRSDLAAGGKFILKIIYPKNTYSDAFSNSSVNFVRMVHFLVLRLMKNPVEVRQGRKFYKGDVIWDETDPNKVFIVTDIDDRTGQAVIQQVDPAKIPDIEKWLEDHFKSNPGLVNLGRA
jgi:hypothetical protein